MFDVKKNKAICVLPWVHEFKKIDGKTAPCCQGNELVDGESIAGIREAMLKGIKPRACNSCYKTESESGGSPRIQETNNWVAKFGEPDIEIQHVILNVRRVVHAIVHYGKKKKV